MENPGPFPLMPDTETSVTFELLNLDQSGGAYLNADPQTGAVGMSTSAGAATPFTVTLDLHAPISPALISMSGPSGLSFLHPSRSTETVSLVNTQSVDATFLWGLVPHTLGSYPYEWYLLGTWSDGGLVLQYLNGRLGLTRYTPPVQNSFPMAAGACVAWCPSWAYNPHK